MSYTKRLLDEANHNCDNQSRLEARARHLPTAPWADDGEEDFHRSLAHLTDLIAREENLAICQTLNRAVNELLACATRTWGAAWMTDEEQDEEAREFQEDLASQQAREDFLSTHYLVPKPPSTPSSSPPRWTDSDP